MARLAERIYMDLMARGKDIGAAGYIRKYLHMQSYRVRKYIMSAGWVFPGWVGFSQWYKREFFDYPPREMLVELGKMSKAECEEHTLFGLYLWEKKCLVRKYHARKKVF
jgi:hypothetical protein